MNNKKEIELISSLIRSVILNENPPEITDDINLDKLIEQAFKHEIVSLLYTALSKSNVSNTEQVKSLEKANLFLALKDSIQTEYLGRIIECFEANKITCTILKGSIIKNLYPCQYLRQSCDIDLLVEEDPYKVRDLMCDMGFDVVEFGKRNSHHDIYAIKPYLVVEIHNKLMRKTHSWNSEFARMVERKISYENYKYIHQFTNEDFYAFMLAHFAKHLKYSGIGFKGVTDIWIYKMKNSDSLNEKTLNELLEKSSLQIFEKHITMLCDYLFEKKKSSDITYMLAQLIYNNGAYGDRDIIASHNLYNQRFKSKIFMVFKGFFASRESLEFYYPILKKYKWMLPVIWGIRGFKLIFKDRAKILKYVKKVACADVNYGEKITDIINEIGL